MKRFFYLLIVFFVFFQMVNFLLNRPIWAETVRESVYAGSFYPADPLELTALLETLTKKALQTKTNLPSQKQLKALILPHAGYIYSGLTAAHAAHVLKEKQFSKVILMGPDHRVGFKGIALSSADAFQTPLGKVRLHKDAQKLRKKSDVFKSVVLSDQQEHSLEVILPFLQYYLKEFTFIPMVMGPGDLGTYTEAIDSVMDLQTLLVVSSDLSHYLPYDDAVSCDTDTIEKIIRLQQEPFLNKQNCACGKIPILVLMRLAEKHGWQPVVLHYANSGDTAGTRDNVVGYAAIAFYGGRQMNDKNNHPQSISEEQGQVLVKLARQTIHRHLGENIAPSASVSEDDLPNLSKEYRGTFVTLKKGGQLRGCIGSLVANEPIVDGVRHNAVNAAFRDPRFRPVSKNELNEISVEVSVLTDPEPLAYTDGNDLIAKLRVNVDGVILRKGSASATFLPQVWEQLPDPKAFLSQLCLKAGLPKDAWDTSKLEVLTYQVEYFEEE